MKIVSQYVTDNIYWRVFGAGDTLYGLGLKDGIIKPNGEVIYENASTFQLEIKVGGVFGKVLKAANDGTIYSNNVELLVDSNGQVTEVVRGSYQSNWVKSLWGTSLHGTSEGTFRSMSGKPFAPGQMVQWRRFSVLPPWYTHGSHDMAGKFYATFICDPYCDFWFEVGNGIQITWYGQLEPC